MQQYNGFLEADQSYHFAKLAVPVVLLFWGCGGPLLFVGRMLESSLCDLDETMHITSLFPEYTAAMIQWWIDLTQSWQQQLQNAIWVMSYLDYSATQIYKHACIYIYTEINIGN